MALIFFLSGSRESEIEHREAGMARTQGGTSPVHLLVDGVAASVVCMPTAWENCKQCLGLVGIGVTRFAE